ncbi:hypothetical protein Tco_1037914 [Tanacetum coccineum]
MSLLASPLQSCPIFPLFQFHRSLYSMAGPVAGNQIARRVIDDLVNFSRETSVQRYMKFFFNQKISNRHRFINRMREEVQTSRNLLGQLTALIVELEASPDPGEVFDTLMCLRDDVRDEQARLGLLGHNIVSESPRLGDKIKYVFGRSRSEDESLGSLMRNLCSALKVSLSNKRRLVAELEVLGELEGAAKSLEHMRVIVGRDAVTSWGVG